MYENLFAFVLCELPFAELARGCIEAVAKAVDTILAAGREFGLPVAMNGSANVRSRMEQGARIFMGGITAEARKEAGR